MLHLVKLLKIFVKYYPVQTFSILIKCFEIDPLTVDSLKPLKEFCDAWQNVVNPGWFSNSDENAFMCLNKAFLSNNVFVIAMIVSYAEQCAKEVPCHQIKKLLLNGL